MTTVVSECVYGGGRQILEVNPPLSPTSQNTYKDFFMPNTLLCFLNNTDHVRNVSFGHSTCSVLRVVDF